LNQVLFKPVNEFMSRPRKSFRTRAIEVGYLLAGTHSIQDSLTSDEVSLCEKAGRLLESIHSGSLIIDDIQDNSQIRRGDRAFHLKHGVPLAINAGNWLYFWQLREVKNWGVNSSQESQIYHRVFEALHRGHIGQALDVGVPVDSIPQGAIYAMCWSSMLLKSGALVGLAFALGGILAQASLERVDQLEVLGQNLGIALQMFDDIGNFRPKSPCHPDFQKNYEDFILMRPTWIWAVAAETYSIEQFQNFSQVVRSLKSPDQFREWSAQHTLEIVARLKAKSFLEQLIQPFSEKMDSNHREKLGHQLLLQIAERLANSYE
jgi:geranylgeranyl pyrophosphate synthase